MLNSAMIRAIVQSNETKIYAGETITFAPNIDIEMDFTTGGASGDNTIDTVGVIQVANAGAKTDFDVTAARSPFSSAGGSAVPFIGLRSVLIQNKSTVNNLHIGKGTANGLSGPWHTSLAAGALALTIRPLQFALFSSCDLPWVVTGTAKTIAIMGENGEGNANIWLFGNTQA